MKKENVLSLMRTLAVFFGSYAVGHHFLGQAVTGDMWETIVGLVVSLAATVWGFFDKTDTLEGLQSLLRSLVTFIGGFFVAKGVITSDQLLQIVAFILPVGSFLYSWLSKKKTENLKKQSTPEQLKAALDKLK